jgi:hypothetical protein
MEATEITFTTPDGLRVIVVPHGSVTLHILAPSAQLHEAEEEKPPIGFAPAGAPAVPDI